MCTYLNGQLAAFTGTLPPNLNPGGKKKTKKAKPAVIPADLKTKTVKKPVQVEEPFWATIQSGGSLPRGTSRDENTGAGRYRGSGCSFRHAGRKPHDHVRHIRCIKADVKRHLVD